MLISEQLSMEKEVVRVWFCNRRQKEKRIYCPVASLSVKSHNYNSRMVSRQLSAWNPPFTAQYSGFLEETGIFQVNGMNEGLHLFKRAAVNSEADCAVLESLLHLLCAFRPRQGDPTAPWLQAEASDPAAPPPEHSAASPAAFSLNTRVCFGFFVTCFSLFPPSFFKFLSKQYQPGSFAKHPVGHLVFADVSDQPGLLQRCRVSLSGS